MAKPIRAVSPNGVLSLEQKGNGYVLNYKGQQVLNVSQVGITTSTVGEGLTFQRMVKRGKVKADYLMKEGKRLHPRNVANEYVCEYADQNGKPVHLVFRLYNDGVAFSPEASAVYSAGLELWRYYFAAAGDSVNENPSFYDIRKYFQGTDEKGRMNNKSSDEQYNALIDDLRAKQKKLASKIAEKVYEYGFLRR